MFKTRGLPYPPEMEISEVKETVCENAGTDLELTLQSDVCLINEVKTGNGDAFRTLAERYNYIISHNISKLYSSFRFMALKTDKEDLFQECRIVLYKAAKCYDFKREVKFPTYANICVKNYLVSLCRKYCMTEKYSGYDFIPLDEIRENEPAMYDRYFAFNDFPSFLETLETTETPETAAFLDSLSALEKKVFMMYIENKSYKYMARILKKSVKSIDNAVCRMKSKLKPYADYFVSEYQNIGDN